jgi:hypothetical protein
MVVDKKLLLCERDDKGELVSKTVDVKGLGEIELIPLTRGEILTMTKGKEDQDVDKDIVLKCLKEPKLTSEEIDDLKPNISKLISQAILDASGVEVPQGDKSPIANN